MARLVIRIADGLDRLVAAMGRVAAWAGVALVLVTVFDVTTRNFSQSDTAFLRQWVALQQDWFGSTKLQELEWHLHTILFALCLGFAYLKGAHVRIDLVHERLRPRTRWCIEIAGILLFMMPFSVLALYFTAQYASMSWAQNEVSASAAGLGHRWLIKATLPTGFALLTVAGVTALGRRLLWLAGKAHPPAAEAGDQPRGDDAAGPQC